MKYEALERMIEIGNEYGPSWQLEDDELEYLATKADEALCTMNGDIGTIEITVRQFAQLVAARAKLVAADAEGDVLMT